MGVVIGKIKEGIWQSEVLIGKRKVEMLALGEELMKVGYGIGQETNVKDSTKRKLDSWRAEFVRYRIETSNLEKELDGARLDFIRNFCLLNKIESLGQSFDVTVKALEQFFTEKIGQLESHINNNANLNKMEEDECSPDSDAVQISNEYLEREKFLE